MGSKESPSCASVGTCSLAVCLNDEVSFSAARDDVAGAPWVRRDEGGSMLSRLLVLLLSVCCESALVIASLRLDESFSVRFDAVDRTSSLLLALLLSACREFVLGLLNMSPASASPNPRLLDCCIRSSLSFCSRVLIRLSAILSLKLLTLGAGTAGSNLLRFKVNRDVLSLVFAARFKEISCALRPLSIPNITRAGDFCSGVGCRFLIGENGTWIASFEGSGERVLASRLEALGVLLPSTFPAVFALAAWSFFNFSRASIA